MHLPRLWWGEAPAGMGEGLNNQASTSSTLNREQSSKAGEKQPITTIPIVLGNLYSSAPVTANHSTNLGIHCIIAHSIFYTTVTD